MRNRLKVRGTVRNAQAFLATCDEYGIVRRLPVGLGRRHARGQPAPEVSDLPARTELSDRLAKDLKRRGFTFVGSTIVYSFLQAVGVVDDHLVTCPSKQ